MTNNDAKAAELSFQERVSQTAKNELRDEAFKQAVEVEKIKIKTSRRHWFPWRLKLIIERRS